jgi:GR25 family glycosyltransferase involved in LPS biosynthesis
VVINLPQRDDRWEAVSQRAAAVGLTNLIKAPAVDGRRLTVETVSALLGIAAQHADAAPASHLSLTRPAIGCFLSHLAVWRWVIEEDLPRVLVLEDDARPTKDFTLPRFRELYERLSDENGLVFVGCMIMDGLAEEFAGSPLARIYYFNGTFAYLITPNMCRTLLGKLVPLRGHLDHQISSVLLNHRDSIKACYTNPQFFEPDWSLRSDCYVPITDDAAADRELAELFSCHRKRLLFEGRPLLAAHSAAHASVAGT